MQQGQEISLRQAAQVLGVSHKSVHRWLDEGRLPYPITLEHLEANRQHLHPRPRGPQRNPKSARYTRGRHTYTRRMVRCKACNELVGDGTYCGLCGARLRG